MVISEIVYFNDIQFKRTYSDENRYVVRDGIEYAEAIDPLESDREYEEGRYITEGI